MMNGNGKKIEIAIQLIQVHEEKDRLVYVGSTQCAL